MLRYPPPHNTPSNTHSLSLSTALTHSLSQLKSMLGQLDEALELTTCALSHARNREEIQELMQLMIYTRSQVRDRLTD